jgi:hypothetical protein
MASIIEGYTYDIFISYRQKDNKGVRWVSEFVDALKDELESTFKEEVSVYFDINPHDGLLETSAWFLFRSSHVLIAIRSHLHGNMSLKYLLNKLLRINSDLRLNCLTVMLQTEYYRFVFMTWIMLILNYVNR